MRRANAQSAAQDRSGAPSPGSTVAAQAAISARDQPGDSELTGAAQRP
jgi:hypothetical protein